MSFGKLTPIAADPVLGLMDRIRADVRPWKIDLGVGVYRDRDGRTPVFAAVKSAERHLIETQDSKAYRGGDGDPAFVAQLADRVFGTDCSRRISVAGLQAVGGTGALRLAAELLARAQPGRRVWLGVPTWANHVPLLESAGLLPAPVDLFDAATQSVRPEALVRALATAAPGDAVLLHGCCHNPTGVDPTPGYCDAMSDLIVARGLVPLVDLAYQGLGVGWDEDAAGLRTLMRRVPHVLTAYSCNKNFGLYRDRVGALFVTADSERDRALLRNHLLAIARTSYSMPPDHGAAVVRTILEDAALEFLWRAELAAMRTRLKTLRTALAVHGRIGVVDLATLADGHGMFATLGLSTAEVEWLQSECAIYLGPAGRINIAGLNETAIERFVAALRAVLQQRSAA